MTAIASSVLTFILLLIFATPVLAMSLIRFTYGSALVLYAVASICVGVIVWGVL